MKSKISEIMIRMQHCLDESQMHELKTALDISLSECELKTKETSLITKDNDWMFDLEDFLISKTLEGKTKTTIERYRYELNRLLSYIGKSVDCITDSDISQYMRLYKTTRKISNQTLKNVRAVFSSFFAWLRDHGRIGANPMILVENIKVEQKIKKPYTDEERELLFRNCKTLRDKAILECLYSTAVRVSELSSLNITDVNSNNKDMVVLGKGGKERVVYLNNKAYMYLQEYLESRTDDNPALFVSLRKPYDRLSKNGIESMLKKIGNKAGVSDAHPHKYRHTAITNALNRGMPLQEAAIFAGHAKTETTMRYWTENQDGIRYHHKKYLSA